MSGMPMVTLFAYIIVVAARVPSPISNYPEMEVSSLPLLKTRGYRPNLEFMIACFAHVNKTKQKMPNKIAGSKIL